MVSTFAILVVMGPAAANLGGFAVVATVDMALGKLAGDITALCIMCFFVVVPAVYNYTFARLLLVGSIDQILPMRLGRLNKNRVPSSAMIFQSMLVIMLTLLAFFLAPSIAPFGKPTDLASEFYYVSQAGATLIWALSTIFLFTDLIGCYVRDRKGFHAARIFPLPILWGSAVLGPVVCLLAIVNTLSYSWIPQITNAQWWWIVGGLTAFFLVCAAIGAMMANSEARWQSWKVMRPAESIPSSIPSKIPIKK